MTTILIDNTSEELDAPDWVTIPTGRGTLGGSVSRANNTKDLTSFSFTFNGMFLLAISYKLLSFLGQEVSSIFTLSCRLLIRQIFPPMLL